MSGADLTDESVLEKNKDERLERLITVFGRIFDEIGNAPIIPLTMATRYRLETTGLGIFSSGQNADTILNNIIHRLMT
ncbi:hypothetical protein ACFLTD_05610 [Elusimicrobiota bacterium]